MNRPPVIPATTRHSRGAGIQRLSSSIRIASGSGSGTEQDEGARDEGLGGGGGEADAGGGRGCHRCDGKAQFGSRGAGSRTVGSASGRSRVAAGFSISSALVARPDFAVHCPDGRPGPGLLRRIGRRGRARISYGGGGGGGGISTSFDSPWVGFHKPPVPALANLRALRHKILPCLHDRRRIFNAPRPRSAIPAKLENVHRIATTRRSGGRKDREIPMTRPCSRR